MILFVIFLSLYIGINFRIAYVLGIIESIAIIAFSFYRFKKKVGLVALATLLIGIGISFIRPNYNKSTYQSLIVEVKENYYIASSGLEKLYVYEKAHAHEIGDIIVLKGYKSELDFSTTESSFNFKEYLNNKGVYSQFIVTSSEIKFANPIKINKVRKEYLSHFDNDTKALISSLLFGISESEESTSIFRDLHLARLISNSGIYLEAFLSIFIFLLSLKIKEKYSILGGLTLFAIYSVFTFPRFVVIKFLLINVLKWVNKYPLKSKFSYLELLSFLAIGFLLLDYHLAYQDSFFLSIFIPLVIVFSISSFKRIKRKYLKILIPVIVALSFVPFAIDYYHEISPISFFLQILLSPLLILFGVLSLISFIGVPLYPLLNGYCQFLKDMLLFIKPICFKIYAPSGGIYLKVIYETVYLVILYFISIGFIEIYKWLLLLSSSLGVLYLVPLKPLIYSSVAFINVGQGDSCLIHDKNVTVMIDTGGLTYTDLATSSLIPYLKSEQIYHIDLLITTHDDFDHYGARDSLIKNFVVYNYQRDYQCFPINIGNLVLYNYNNYPSLWKEENDYSLVIGFTLKGYSFLLMGDAPKKIESQIIKDYPNLRTDYLKVGHHGSKTSTSDAFVKNIQPKEAIISCGKNNKFGHPHQEVVNILKKNKVTIRRTDIEGTIKYSFI